MSYTRRDFLRAGALFVSMSLTMPSFLARTIQATSDRAISAVYGRRKILVVVQLGGGNDGLNTVVPYADPAYYQARPTIGIAKSAVLQLSDYVGLHPNMTGLKARFDAGQLAVVQGVGYPNPNRSHFRATEIWQTAQPDSPPNEGWLGRYLDAACCGEDKPVASESMGVVNVADTLPLTLWTEHVLVPSIGSTSTFKFQTDGGEAPDERLQHLDAFRKLYAQSTAPHVHDDFVRSVGRSAVDTSEQLQAIARSYTPSVTYPNTTFATQLKQVAQIMSGDLGTRIYYVQLGGFDTHANQPTTQGGLLRTFSDGIHAFLRDLEAKGTADDVAILAFSEFGRRVAENGSQGTDHGSAAPVFVVGPGVKGGLIGAHPSLTDLNSGDLRFAIDFRSVYASILRDWLEGDPKAVLGDFQPLGILPPRNLGPVPPPAPGMARTYLQFATSNAQP
ncbi:MAG TPA: DUF1501 domain-containing protein [Chloroflexota bacterium]|nr:DUF1501 domain-containing protein [Chloroflexota bacterium]